MVCRMKYIIYCSEENVNYVLYMIEKYVGKDLSCDIEFVFGNFKNEIFISSFDVRTLQDKHLNDICLALERSENNSSVEIPKDVLVDDKSFLDWCKNIFLKNVDSI